MLALDAERLATGLAMGVTLNKRLGLLFQHVPLNRLEELFRFRQRQAEMLNVLAGFP
jgi:hypothetical protein